LLDASDEGFSPRNPGESLASVIKPETTGDERKPVMLENALCSRVVVDFAKLIWPLRNGARRRTGCLLISGPRFESFCAHRYYQ
jgi:hypothetical protein